MTTTSPADEYLANRYDRLRQNVDTEVIQPNTNGSMCPESELWPNRTGEPKRHRCTSTSTALRRIGGGDTLDLPVHLIAREARAMASRTEPLRDQIEGIE